jgi:DNA-binding CsgD family transcriptional regulator
MTAASDPGDRLALADLSQLSKRQRELFDLLAEGISLRSIARRLGISYKTLDEHRAALLQKLNVTTTADLRGHASLASGISTGTWLRPAVVRLYHQSHWLPDLTLFGKGVLSRECRARLKCHRLREVADYLHDCDDKPGPRPDDMRSLIAHGTGTLGAKQSLIAALAMERNRRDVRLIVACIELVLDPAVRNTGADHPRTLPLAVCYLNYQGRRLQIADPSTLSPWDAMPVSEVAVDPALLAAERVRLYREFAADWCRALEVEPQSFASLRAAQLQATTSRAAFEDLMGYHLPADFAPSL